MTIERDKALTSAEESKSLWETEIKSRSQLGLKVSNKCYLGMPLPLRWVACLAAMSAVICIISVVDNTLYIKLKWFNEINIFCLLAQLMQLEKSYSDHAVLLDNVNTQAVYHVCVVTSVVTGEEKST